MSRDRSDVFIDASGFAEVSVELLDDAVRRALASDASGDVELSLTLLPDEEMRRLNREFLGKDRTTDVLAFGLSEGGGPRAGDIYIGYEQAVRQAEDHDVPLREELARLAIHGTLHVLGHDHPDGPERSGSAMFRVQERLLRELLEDADRA